jgi:hypothetical protein
LLNLIERFSVNQGSLKLYNDCSRAVNLITNPGRKFKRYLLDDYDLICETQLSIQKLREKISFQLLWVKGHFTGRKKEIQHDLNEEAHNLAKSALLAANQASTDISPPSSLAYLQLGHILTSKWQHSIRELAHSELLQNTICKNTGWSEDQFYMVDWNALQAGLKGVSKVKLLSYCKLIHGILNTNEQNHKFYGSTSHCPHCKASVESFLHVVTCPCPTVTDYRSQQQDTLWKSLKALRTPQIILQYIQRGINSCDSMRPSESSSANQEDSGSTQSSGSYSAFSLAAFNEQSIHVGWDQLLRGRLSKRWREAFHQELSSRNTRANATLWAGGVIIAVLDYSLSLWKFRCELLYGRTNSEQVGKILAELSQKVTHAYREYEQDPFIVRHDYRHLFAVSLARRLLQDRDCLQLFLTTFELAKQERAHYTKLQSEKAQKFFFPRSLPQVIQFRSKSESSILSNFTVSTGLTHCNSNSGLLDSSIASSGEMENSSSDQASLSTSSSTNHSIPTGLSCNQLVPSDSSIDSTCNSLSFSVCDSLSITSDSSKSTAYQVTAL